MKILTNTNSSKNGGIARRVREMVLDAERREGVELVVVEINHTERSVEHYKNVVVYKVPTDPHIPHRNVYHGLTDIDGLHERFEPLVEDIRKIMDIEEPDIVLSEGTYYAPWCFYQAAGRSGVPRIVLYTGILSEEVKNWLPEKRDLMKAMEREFFDPSLLYIFPSQLARRKVETEVFAQDIPRAVVIPNGVADEFFEERKPDNRDGVGFVGRASHVKNPEYLLQLAKEFKRKGYTFRIQMVTDLPETSRLAAGFRAAGIEIKKPMRTNEIGDFYSSREVMISPSYFETFGNVPIEAVATGTPAFVSSNMGVHEVFLELGLEKLVIDFGNIPEVADQIAQTIHETKTLDIREEIRKRYNWKRTLDRYYEACKTAGLDKAA